MAWAALVPYLGLTLAALVWGRVRLTRGEVRTALLRTLAATLLLALPVTWAFYGYCAGFNPTPRTPAAVIGGLFAFLLLPVDAALIAYAAFEFAAQAARARGAASRPLAIRIVATLFLIAAAFLGLSLLGVGALLSAGPKAMG